MQIYSNIKVIYDPNPPMALPNFTLPQVEARNQILRWKLPIWGGKSKIFIIVDPYRFFRTQNIRRGSGWLSLP
jgi:hypothetical protein